MVGTITCFRHYFLELSYFQISLNPPHYHSDPRPKSLGKVLEYSWYRFKMFFFLFCVSIYRTGVQPDVSHAHAQRQEAVHMSRLRQRILPELRSQETLAQTPRRPLSAAPVLSNRATGLHSRIDGSTSFATAAAERPPRPWNVRATVPVGPGWISKERNHV